MRLTILIIAIIAIFASNAQAQINLPKLKVAPAKNFGHYQCKVKFPATAKLTAAGHTFIEGGDCLSCAKGYKLDKSGVMTGLGDFVCRRLAKRGRTPETLKPVLRGRAGCRGSLRVGNTCYTCPKGYRRNPIGKITSKRACIQIKKK